MIILAIVIASLIFVAFLRFGANAVYDADGLIVTARIGPISIRAFPREEMSKIEKRKALRKVRKKARKRVKTKIKKPGGLKAFLDMIPAIKKTLSRLRRKLLIKRLTIHYTAAGADAAATALSYGAANAVFETITPVLENNFRIKRRDFQAHVDFTGVEQTIYINASVSLSVWEAIYIFVSMIPIFTYNMKKE